MTQTTPLVLLLRAVLTLFEQVMADQQGQAVTATDLNAALQPIRKDIRTMATDIAATLAALKNDVAAQTTVIASVKTFIGGLSDQLAAALEAASAAGATEDQLAELTALDAAVKSNTEALSAAVPANTPAAPTETAAEADPTAT